MITLALAVTVGTVAVVNMFLSQAGSHTVKIESHQSSPSATPVVSITIIPNPTSGPTPTPLDINIEDKIAEANQRAKDQVDRQRQQAIDQVNRQIDQAIDQLESTQAHLPSQATSVATPILTQQKQQLEQQRQRMIDQLNHQVQWPDLN